MDLTCFLLPAFWSLLSAPCLLLPCTYHLICNNFLVFWVWNACSRNVLWHFLHYSVQVQAALSWYNYSLYTVSNQGFVYESKLK